MLENSKEILNSEKIVLEPIKKYAQELSNSKEKIIFLGPNQGVGRSLLLTYLEQIDLENESRQTIYMKFDSAKKFPKNGLHFQEHYYEIIFALKLLYYIKKIHPNLFQFFFEMEWQELYYSLEETVACSNQNFRGHILFLKKVYSSQELVAKIIKKWKNLSSILEFQLIIDDFDKIDDNNPNIQKLLSRYFELFSKIILTTDDSYTNHHLYHLEYSKNVDFVSEILKKRFLVKDIFSQDVLKEAIEIAQGNLNILLCALEDMNFIEWKTRQDFNDIFLQYVRKKKQELEENSKSLKLYI